jgi:hypothetical protein
MGQFINGKDDVYDIIDWSTEGATGPPKVRPKDDVYDIID